MIRFKDNNDSKPYKKFRYLYTKAKRNKQSHIDAISISSYDKNADFVDSRYVNLKIIENDEWVFFSNYKSPKALQFKSYNQISILFFWESINVQIRIKAKISKITQQKTNSYFEKRSKNKNALAISSQQSAYIDSYKTVVKNYNYAFKNYDLSKCPKYWGGYAFKPYYFEFWEGHKFRLNKRTAYEFKNYKWNEKFLQP